MFYQDAEIEDLQLFNNVTIQNGHKSSRNMPLVKEWINNATNAEFQKAEEKIEAKIHKIAKEKCGKK